MCECEQSSAADSASTSQTSAFAFKKKKKIFVFSQQQSSLCVLGDGESLHLFSEGVFKPSCRSYLQSHRVKAELLNSRHKTWTETLPQTSASLTLCSWRVFSIAGRDLGMQIRAQKTPSTLITSRTAVNKGVSLCSVIKRGVTA